MLLATMICMYLRFTVNYSSHRAGLCCISVLGLALVVSLLLVLFLRYFDPSLTSMKKKMNHDLLSIKKHFMYEMQESELPINSRCSSSTIWDSYESTITDEKEE